MKTTSTNVSAPVASGEPARGSQIADIVATLEEDIVFGRLHPRERLVEDDLMQRFGSKRHVVREVLATLDRLGLVERRRNVGALVRWFTPREVSELYALRVMLESEAARLVPLPVPEAALEKLVAIQNQHDDAVKASDAPRVFRANQAFHRVLFELTENETIQRAIEEYSRQTHPIRFSALVMGNYRERARIEHWEIIGALRAGDRETLVRLCGDHLLPSRDAYLAAHGHQINAA